MTRNRSPHTVPSVCQRHFAKLAENRSRLGSTSLMVRFWASVTSYRSSNFLKRPWCMFLHYEMTTNLITINQPIQPATRHVPWSNNWHLPTSKNPSWMMGWGRGLCKHHLKEQCMVWTHPNQEMGDCALSSWHAHLGNTRETLIKMIPAKHPNI